MPSRYSASVQVVTEVLYDGEWHYTDANFFKNHVIPRKPDGSLPTLEWLRPLLLLLPGSPGEVPAYYATGLAGRRRLTEPGTIHLAIIVGAYSAIDSLRCHGPALRR